MYSAADTKPSSVNCIFTPQVRGFQNDMATPGKGLPPSHATKTVKRSPHRVMASTSGGQAGRSLSSTIHAGLGARVGKGWSHRRRTAVVICLGGTEAWRGSQKSPEMPQKRKRIFFLKKSEKNTILPIEKHLDKHQLFLDVALCGGWDRTQQDVTPQVPWQEPVITTD